MQKTKKKLAGKIAALVLLLTVISCCFVGSTFAKYTSSNSGTATAQVAKWQVDGVSANTQVNAFELTAKLSPKEDNTDNTVSATYTITNNSDVAAKIEWTAAEADYAINAVADATYNGKDVSYTSGTGFEYTPDGATAKETFLTDAKVKDTITISVSATKGGTAVTGTNVTLAAKTATAESVIITVTATWNTQDDATDTLIGMYVESITQQLTVTATQASEVPQTPAA